MLDFPKFTTARDRLVDRYVNEWHNDAAFFRFDALKGDLNAYIKSLDCPRPVKKAKAFAYILENAPLTLCADDPFAVALEAHKMRSLHDVGANYERIMPSFIGDLSKEMDRTEDGEFISLIRDRLVAELYTDYNHSTPCWEDIHALGIPGLLARSRKYRSELENPSDEQNAYFDGIELTYEAILRFFERAADAVENEVTASALRNITKSAPSDTYEALLLSWLFWYLQENIEGIRVRTMGGIDRLYRPFVERDIASGRLTREDAVELFAYFMCEFHAFGVWYGQPIYFGGYNDDGSCAVNEVSYIGLEAYNLLSAPNPKLQAKINPNTPDKFVDTVLETIRRGNSSISIINDEVATKSLEKLGIPNEEARTYLMAGCWDYTVKNHEVKTIPVRVSLPKILEYTLTDGICLTTEKRVLPALGKAPETFEEFLELYRRRFAELFERLRSIIEHWEKYLEYISPSNMFSGTHTDSLSRAVDGYSRGMKYNSTVYQVFGMATLVDSLIAIKKHVYDSHELTLSGLVEVLKNNWEGSESLRRVILNDSDKYGNGSEVADELAVSLYKYFAELINGKPNSRGSAELGTQGYWKLGTLSIDKNVRVGSFMKATPDGRLAGEPISKNLSSVVGMDRGGVTVFLNSVAKIDFTDFPHAGMVDVVLHPSAVSGEDGLIAFRGLVRAYFKKGGHSIQFNVFDSQLLRDAQREPEKYRNLQVRVCGWNVYFVQLEKVLQDAFIREAEKSEACGI